MIVAKKTPKIVKKAKPEVAPEVKKLHFFEAIGRRKTAVARVQLQPDSKDILINGKPLDKYFPTPELRQLVVTALEKMSCLDKFGIVVRVKGGGLHAQAEAVRHGVARALTKFNAEFRKRLKSAGFLTRDSRMRERKKPGLKRARRAPQWTKR